MHDPQPNANQYDVIPYPDRPHACTHPRRLEVMAALFGMTPASILDCRVLELGCAAGGNLIPLAQDLPESSFVGIELSKRQAEQGMETIKSLGLKNIELKHADLMQVDRSWGKFDYIICHGVLSWVQPEAQDEILAICKSNLAPDGVAFLSYNTYPGWHIAAFATDLMRYHGSQFQDPRKRIDEAKDMLTFMADNCDRSTAAARALAEEFRLLSKIDDDEYLYHEHLETNNRPLYFAQVVNAANAIGLQYLCEINLSEMLIRNMPDNIREKLAGLPLVRQEQYMDFLRARRFRKTLLCHAQIELQRRISPEKIEHFHLRLAGDPEQMKINTSDENETVFSLGDSKLTVRDTADRDAILHLTQVFPEYVSFDRLCARVLGDSPQCSKETGAESAARHQLRETMLSALSVAMVDVCIHPPRCTSELNEQPVASPLARLQAKRGNSATTQHHEWTALDDLGRYVIQRLDGAHDRNSLVGSVREAILAGDIAVSQGDEGLEDVDPKVISHFVNSTLERIARMGYLIG